MKEIKISAATPLPELSYEQSFQIAKNAGFDTIDFLPTVKHFIFPLPDINALSKKYALPVTGMHSPLHLIAYTPEFLFKRIMELTKPFPLVKTYVVHMTMIMNYVQNNPKKARKIAAMGKERGITICFESNPIFFPLQYFPKETYVPKAYGDFCVKNNLPMTFDTSHISSVGGDIVEFYKTYYKDIRMMHLSDFKDGVEHLPFEEGALPLTKLFDAMKKTKQDHHIVFEIGNFPHAKTIEDKTKALKKSVRFMKEYFA